MQLANLAKTSQQLSKLLQQHSPTILTGLAVTGLVTTVIMAVKATPKVLSVLEDTLQAKEKAAGKKIYVAPDIQYITQYLTKREIIEATWKLYLPSALMATSTIACIITANSIHLRKNAALMGLYSLSETTLREYQSKVVQTIGRTKEDHIQADLAQEKLNRNPLVGQTIILTEKGDVLFFEELSGRYFRSDIEKIKKIQNEVNHQLLNNMYLTLNEVYFEMGLEPIDLGKDAGWETNHLLEFRFDSKITPDGQPCIVLGYIHRPIILR